MRKITLYILYLVIAFSIYHTIRDVLQIVGIRHLLVDIMGKQKHNWCKPLCDYYTFPWELFVFFGSVLILKRDEFGLLGKIILFSFILWPMVLILNWLLG